LIGAVFLFGIYMNRYLTDIFVEKRRLTTDIKACYNVFDEFGGFLGILRLKSIGNISNNVFYFLTY
jgi:hypothetical protein